MKFVIFVSIAMAISRNYQITQACHFDDGVTNNYANILKYPNKDSVYAIPIVTGYEQYFTQTELDSAKFLSRDWYAKDTL